MSELLNRKHYEGKEGTKLKVHLDDETVSEIELKAFEDASNDDVEGFHVEFEGAEDQPFDQGVHKVEHPDAGEGQVFLVPIINKKTGKRSYQLTVASLKESDDA